MALMYIDLIVHVLENISLDVWFCGLSILVTLVLILYSRKIRPIALNKSEKVVRSVEIQSSIVVNDDGNDNKSQNHVPVTIVSPPRQSVHSNTPFDVDEFKLRMYKTGFLVKRNKSGVSKLRCIIISENCEFCMHKDVQSLLTSTWGSYLKPYVKFPLKSMLDCFQCDGSLDQNLICEFAGLTVHLTAASALDAYYLVTGFKTLISRLKYDQYFLDTYGDALATEPSRFSADQRLRKLACSNSSRTIALPTTRSLSHNASRHTERRVSFEEDQSTSSSGTGPRSSAPPAAQHTPLTDRKR